MLIVMVYPCFGIQHLYIEDVGYMILGNVNTLYSCGMDFNVESGITK